MLEREEPVAFIARELSPVWPRYSGHVESEVPQPHLIEDGPGWNQVDAGILWGTARASEVLVRLGATGATYYSAGDVDPRPDPDYPDDVMPRWPPSRQRLDEDLEMARQSPEQLDATDRKTWCEAAHELGALRIAKAVEPLIEALSSQDPAVLSAAVVALFDLRDPRAITPLVALLQTEPDSERFVAAFDAAEALSVFDNAEANRTVAAWRAQGW